VGVGVKALTIVVAVFQLFEGSGSKLVGNGSLAMTPAMTFRVPPVNGVT
jgi:hypothetical protein